jgi:hypothetical protein
LHISFLVLVSWYLLYNVPCGFTFIIRFQNFFASLITFAKILLYDW